jgi:hypothetical protein
MGLCRVNALLGPNGNFGPGILGKFKKFWERFAYTYGWSGRQYGELLFELFLKLRLSKYSNGKIIEIFFFIYYQFVYIYFKFLKVFMFMMHFGSLHLK